jgi:hypothetical protein
VFDVKCFIVLIMKKRIPETIATATMEGGSNSGMPCNRRRKEVAEDLNIMGIKTGTQWPETVGNGGRLYWKPRSTTDRSARGEGPINYFVFTGSLIVNFIK